MSQEGVIVTIRLIRSFEHRNIRHLVLRHVDLDWTAGQLMERVRGELVNSSNNLPPPFRKFHYDTLKIEHQPHGAKTNDPVINTEHDDLLLLRPESTLKETGVKHETELSFFVLKDYTEYKKTTV